MTNGSVAGVNYADGFKLTALGGAAADPTGDLPGGTNYSVEVSRGSTAAGTGQRSLVGFVSPESVYSNPQVLRYGLYKKQTLKPMIS